MLTLVGSGTSLEKGLSEITKVAAQNGQRFAHWNFIHQKNSAKWAKPFPTQPSETSLFDPENAES